jgi:hypothetical protein
LRSVRPHFSLIFVWCIAVRASTALADEPRRTIDMSRALGTPAPSTTSDRIAATAPDPTPLSERNQWLFDLRWDRGEVWLLGARPMTMRAPRETPRAMGRFALELYEGPTLIERVRFDFPLLGAADLADETDGFAGLSRGLRTRVGVLFPATRRGTRLELWDRATDVRWSLPWPPLSAENRAVTRPSGAPAVTPAPPLAREAGAAPAHSGQPK